MPADKKAENLSDAAKKTAAALQGLQSRLARQPALAIAPEETMEDLGKQLQEYFSTAVVMPFSSADEIRERVVQGVVDRIMRAWEDPRGQLSPALKKEVVEQLVERVLDRLASFAQKVPTRSTGSL